MSQIGFKQKVKYQMSAFKVPPGYTRKKKKFQERTRLKSS